MEQLVVGSPERRALRAVGTRLVGLTGISLNKIYSTSLIRGVKRLDHGPDTLIIFSADSEELPMACERIVVVEDHVANRLTLIHLLKKMGFEVLGYENGLAAWQFISDSQNSVDLILSDIMMPEMDGIELLKRCREMENHKATPFYLITAVADKDYMAAAKAAGVDGYVVKPLTFERLKSKMQDIFPNKKLAV